MAPKTLRSIAAVAALVFASFGGGYLLGQHADRQPQIPTQGNQEGHNAAWIEKDLLRFEFVQDAVGRWATKNGTSVERILEEATPQAMSFSDRACVQFVRRRPALGGAPPVYCYEVDKSGWPTTQLVYEQSDVGE